jgi:hypothetical protein
MKNALGKSSQPGGGSLSLALEASNDSRAAFNIALRAENVSPIK